MSVLDTIEDAFLEALEQGATPPRELTIRLPWEAMNPSVFAGSPIRVAGHTIHVVPDGGDARWPQ